MGHWGFDYSESDTYLDLLDSVFDPIEKILNAETFYVEEYIAASGLLLDLLSNKNIRYVPLLELLDIVIDKIIYIINFTDFKDWHPNEEKRKEATILLLKNLKRLRKKNLDVHHYLIR